MNLRSKKESGESGDKKAAPDRKKPMQKKRSGGWHDDDDESVDSRGNIRGLIVTTTDEEASEAEDGVVQKKRRVLQKSSSAKKQKAAVESEAAEESEEEEERSPKKRSGFLPRPKKSLPKKGKKVEESEEEGGPSEIIISMGGYEDDYLKDKMTPKRHNMKKETKDVKKFVELITKPMEEGGIDDQIDEFKRLTEEKQKEMLEVLDRKTTADTTKQSMMFKILTMKTNPDIQNIILSKYRTMEMMEPMSGEYFKLRSWLEKATELPLGLYREIPVKLGDGTETCGAFMEKARRCLGEAIYGQEEAKMQILQFIASKIANPEARGLSLLLAGPPGIGKTSLIKNGIAKALEWPFQFISLGGDSDASTYTGHQVVYEGSHCGKVVNCLIGAKSMSMVLLFDELDKVSTTAKGEEVQNLLVHMTDAVQNSEFEDKYLTGIPLDLSKILFTFSANNLEKIDKILLDRMVVVNLQGYEKKEKLAIAEQFLIPGALAALNLAEKVHIQRDVLEHILTDYASEEKGVRELKRCIEQVAQKINMLRIFNSKDLAFHIPEFHLPFILKKSHVDLFLKKKTPAMDLSAQRMYS